MILCDRFSLHNSQTSFMRCRFKRHFNQSPRKSRGLKHPCLINSVAYRRQDETSPQTTIEQRIKTVLYIGSKLVVTCRPTSTESIGSQRFQIFPKWHPQRRVGEILFCSTWSKFIQRLVTGRLTFIGIKFTSKLRISSVMVSSR